MKKNLFTLFMLIAVNLSAETIHLKQKDFDGGTYLIEKPGTYILEEDISFNPNSIRSLKTDAYHAGFLLPEQYRSQGGKYDDASFGLGFFAAIAISADGVILDLNGHTLEQSKEHALQQRFFAVLELANQPFIPSQGPHNFGKRLTGGKNVTIKNGTIGRSAHHGIHGNDNKNIAIENVQFKDFEVAAIALNGVDGLLIRNSTASSRKDVPVMGTFSAVRFLKPYLDYLVESGSETTLNIGGNKKLTAREARDRIIEAVNNVNHDLITRNLNSIDPAQHPEEYALFHNPEQVIDGNCYGYLINSLGQAIEGFPVYANIRGSELSKNIRFENVHVKSLEGKVNEIIALNQGGKGMTDPVGAVFQVMNLSPHKKELITIEKINEGEFIYKGNLLANAQALIAKANLNGDFYRSNLDLSRSIITKEVIDWIESDPETAQKKHLDFSRQDLLCNADSMFHVNKGVVGFKVDGASNVELNNTTVQNIVNMSEVGSELCGLYTKSHPKATLEGCGGPKTRGYSFAGSRNVEAKDCMVYNIDSYCGSAAGFDILTDSGNITIIDSTVEGITAGKKFHHNEGPNEPPKAIGFRVSTKAQNVALNNIKVKKLQGFAESKDVLDESRRARRQ